MSLQNCRPPRLSIVATLYRSRSYIAEFYRRAVAAATKLVGEDYEIVFVNDGSPDDSCQVAVQLIDHDPRVVVVDLSRNFGHHKAMMTGLAHARGERVFLIDTDLEEEPEWLLDFAQQMDEQCCDVVYGVQEKRKGRWFERWSGDFFYRIFNACSGMALPRNVVTARLMTQAYVQALVAYQEREIFIVGLWHLTGFQQVPRVIRKHHSSKSTYTLKRKISMAINGITAFSSTPLVGIFYVGMGISFFSSIYMLYIFLNWLFFSAPPSGWTSMIASIWFLGGWMICFIGVIGLYIAKIFIETKQRPYTIVKKIHCTCQRDVA